MFIEILFIEKSLTRILSIKIIFLPLHNELFSVLLLPNKFMLKLLNFSVDIPIEDLQKTSVVFTIEFEYDSRLLVCNTEENETVQAALTRILKQIQTDYKRYYPITRIALDESQYLTVEAFTPPTPSAGQAPIDIIDILVYKYTLVKKYNTIIPGGHNVLYVKGQSALEQSIIRDMLASLGLNKELRDYKTGLPKPKGRPIREVYQFEQINGLWQLKRSFQSLSAIKQVFPGIAISNISMCCKDSHRTAYGFKWSYDKNASTLFNRYI